MDKKHRSCLRNNVNGRTDFAVAACKYAIYNTLDILVTS